MTADIVSAYVEFNALPAAELTKLIADVRAALGNAVASEQEVTKPEPAIDPKRSVQRDRIVCLECGQKFKALKRHLNAVHDLTPDEYREKWALLPDYPITAPSYSEARSALAKDLGLGRKAAPKKARRTKAKAG